MVWDGFSTASAKTRATPESIATSAPSRIRFASSNSSAALESWFGAHLVVFFPITDSTIKKRLAADALRAERLRLRALGLAHLRDGRWRGSLPGPQYPPFGGYLPAWPAIP